LWAAQKKVVLYKTKHTRDSEQKVEGRLFWGPRPANDENQLTKKFRRRRRSTPTPIAAATAAAAASSLMTAPSCFNLSFSGNLGRPDDDDGGVNDDPVDPTFDSYVCLRLTELRKNTVPALKSPPKLERSLRGVSSYFQLLAFLKISLL